MSSMRGITGMIGPVLYTTAFAQAIAHKEWELPGAPWFVAAALIFCSVVVIARATSGSGPPPSTPA
jgi:hypothetical protein